MQKCVLHLTNSAPDHPLINDLKIFQKKSCMLPFPNNLTHFEICLAFGLAEIGQNVG